MRYLVKARVKPGRSNALLRAIAEGTLGRGSVAGDEYLRNMDEARVGKDGIAQWVEVCFCATPLQEERPYWEEYFELVSVKDAHNRQNCRDWNGTEPWACVHCDCTQRLEERLRQKGESFSARLRRGEGECLASTLNEEFTCSSPDISQRGHAATNAEFLSNREEVDKEQRV